MPNGPRRSCSWCPWRRPFAWRTTLLSRGVPTLLEKPPGASAAEVDRLIAAAERGPGRPRPCPTRWPSIDAMCPSSRSCGAGWRSWAPLQHLHYEMVRVDRRDPDFSTTAIHGIDAVRYLAGSDYASGRFRYQRDAGARTGRGQHVRGRGPRLRRHRPPRLLPGGGRGPRARHRAGPRPHFPSPRAHVGRRRFAGPAPAFRGRPPRRGPRRRDRRRRNGSLRAGRLLPRDRALPGLARGRPELHHPTCAPRASPWSWPSACGTGARGSTTPGTVEVGGSPPPAATRQRSGRPLLRENVSRLTKNQ